MIELLPGMISTGEGNISFWPHRMKVMGELLKKYKPKNIIEIGFNLGHSCKFIIDTLESLPDYDGIDKFYIFDICEMKNLFTLDQVFNNPDRIGGGHDYVKSNFDILKNHYKHIDLQLIPGDSRMTVKPFLDSLNLKFDFVEIDGSHEFDAPKVDIDSTINYVNNNGLIYIDDYIPFFPAIINAVSETDWISKGFEINFDVEIPGGEIFWAVKNNL